MCLHACPLLGTLTHPLCLGVFCPDCLLALSQVRFVYFEAQVPLAKVKGDGTPEGGLEDGNRGVSDPGVAPPKSPHNQDEEAERPIFCVETAAW